MEKSVFNVLNEINVQDHVEKKNGLNYLSWAWAWQEVKKLYPNAQYKIYERNVYDEFGNVTGTINYFTDGMTCWVKTGVTIEELEHIEMLPIMDFKNKSIPLDKVTSFDVNKAIQRSLTKALARHGLGLYIYAGEDLPEADKKKEEDDKLAKATIEYTRLRNKLDELHVDYRSESFVKWLIKTTGLETQDISKLRLNEVLELNRTYAGVIKNKESKQNA